MSHFSSSSSSSSPSSVFIQLALLFLVFLFLFPFRSSRAQWTLSSGQPLPFCSMDLCSAHWGDGPVGAGGLHPCSPLLSISPCFTHGHPQTGSAQPVCSVSVGSPLLAFVLTHSQGQSAPQVWGLKELVSLWQPWPQELLQHHRRWRRKHTVCSVSQAQSSCLDPKGGHAAAYSIHLELLKGPEWQLLFSS